MYDDDDFSALTMCCACEGRSLNLASTAPTKAKLPVLNLNPEYCVDTATTTDTTGDGCDWYDRFNSTCGDFDDDDFFARLDCCACGGG